MAREVLGRLVGCSQSGRERVYSNKLGTCIVNSLKFLQAILKDLVVGRRGLLGWECRHRRH